jgi:hypothetical protein
MYAIHAGVCTGVDSTNAPVVRSTLWKEASWVSEATAEKDKAPLWHLDRLAR